MLTPGSPQWCKVVTASKVAAILGHSPWMSQRTVWHLMRGEYEQHESDVMRRGTFLEDGVLRWWEYEHPDYAVSPQPQYALGTWAAATPDGHAQALGLPDLLVEVKTAANDAEWGQPGTDEIPAHYLTQCYWGMHLAGIEECRVAVLLPRLTFAEYVVCYDAEIGALLEQRCRAFYDSLTGEVPPQLDDSVSTLECLKALHPDIDRGEQVDVPADLARDFVTAGLDKADAEQRDRAARIKLLDIAGRAQYLICGGVTVARRQPSAGGGVSLVRTLSDPTILEGTTAA